MRQMFDRIAQKYDNLSVIYCQNMRVKYLSCTIAKWHHAQAIWQQLTTLLFYRICCCFWVGRMCIYLVGQVTLLGDGHMVAILSFLVLGLHHLLRLRRRFNKMLKSWITILKTELF